MTTITAFYNGLADTVVTGVKRRYRYEPPQVTTADLPAQWVRLPQSGNDLTGGWASACDETGKSRTAELVIAVEAAGQNTAPSNTSAVLTLMDALETALDASDLMPQIEYTLDAQGVNLGTESAYWAIVATITGRGG